MQVRIKKNKTFVFAIAAMLVIIFVIVALIATQTLVNNLLGFVAHMPVFPTHVPTPSMFPTINQGDVIFVDTWMEFADATLNDIVVFDAPVGMTVHRVIGFGNGTLITQGDNNPDPDRLPVTEQTYIGSVIFVLENGSYYAVLILGCVLGLFARYAWLRVKLKRNKRIIVDKGKSRNWKSMLAVSAAGVIGYVIPILILVLIPTSIFVVSASFVIVMFTVFISIIAINVRSGDPDKMLRWLSKSSTFVIIMIGIGSAVITVYLSLINLDSESNLQLINILRTITLTVSTGTMLLVIAMWFSHKGIQKLQIHLDHLDTGLFDIHEDKDGKKTHTSKLDKLRGRGQWWNRVSGSHRRNRIF